MFRNLMFALILGLVAGGCTGIRFVIDAVPATDELTETVVMEDDDSGGRGGAKVALVDVTGLIADSPRFGLLAPGENPISRFVESLYRAEKDKDVKAVVIRINSPGGTVTASDMMYREVKHFRERTKKPVVMCMADVAASGGYYLACAGDEIIASPTTVTGSIGVIMQTINVSEGLRKIGVKSDAITSGPNKAMGNPLEPMPQEHRVLLQDMVNEFYANFRSIVIENRPGISEYEIQTVTDGRVVSGRRAVEAGLVDRLGDLRDAFNSAKSRADVKSAKLVKYHRQLEYVGSPYARAPVSPAGGTEINMVQLNLDFQNQQAGFYYLWDPSIEW